MKGLNKVEIIGNLGKAPELKYTQAGKAVCRFSVAVNEPYDDAQGNKQEKTTWFSCIAWEGVAELINKYLKSGDPVFLEAKFGIFESKDEAQVVKKLPQFTVKNVIFLGAKKPAQAPAAAQSNGGGTITDDDIPF